MVGGNEFGGVGFGSAVSGMAVKHGLVIQAGICHNRATNHHSTRLMPLSPTRHVAAILALLCGLVVVAVFIRYHQRVLPNIFIDGLAVGGLTALETRELLIAQTDVPEEPEVSVRVDDIIVSSSSAQLGLTRLVDPALEQAFAVGRQGSLWRRSLAFVKALGKKQTFSTRLAYQSEPLSNLISNLANQVDYPGKEPQAKLKYSGSSQSLSIAVGSFGRKLNQAATKEVVMRALNQAEFAMTAVVASTAGELSEAELTLAQARAGQFVGKKVALVNDDQRVLVNDQELIALLAFPSGVRESVLTEHLANWESKLYREAREPVFAYDPQSLVVTKFAAPQDGTQLLVGETRANLLAAMTKIESGDTAETHQAELPLRRTPPQRSLAETNQLGINERIGLGTSHYAHSIPNRIHNVALTTGKISLALVPPGKEFSFNKTLGEVSSKTGFRSAYVIKNGQTQLGDGGGVCQVSTTLFRAVLNAGLKITRRLPHSYRVSYYELDNKPGIDATVYAGETDFRFTNDTDHYILVYGEADSTNLSMKIELYGTSDGRTSEIVDHVTWDPHPPLPPQYIPTTALPAGKLQQVDWSAPGISAKFTNIVKDKDGKEIHHDTFTSVYRPWAAKFLQGV
ncbi:MAG: hypothetical protein A3A82_00190 [Candidatus Pacebacteria bacterium RIFCSPLOWO2_01_FULL_47_12]|nr:MAG: hypothetical protein A3A82_00190 [Candidatus Pacebacteria bacterium RIFCSPLOWO2_01_FULL_47_12]